MSIFPIPRSLARERENLAIRPKTLFGLALIPPVIVGLGALVRMATLPHYYSEDFTREVCLWALSGVFAALQWLLLVERRLRGDEIGWVGSWTLMLAAPLALTFCACGVGLDVRKGGGFSAVSVPGFAVPFLIVVVPTSHVLARRLKRAWQGAAFALLTSAGLLILQVRLFSSWQEAIWILLGIFFLPFTLAVSLLLGVGAIRRRRRNLRDKGFVWVTWRDAAFATLNNLQAGRVPPHEEVATLPGYREGDIRALCLLARAS